jgi:uncharacterized protein (TIGR03435 family)
MRVTLTLANLMAWFSLGMYAQTEAPRAFEVVSVKPTPPERLNHLKYEKCNGGGPFISQGTPLLWTIEFAYRVNDIDLAPGWPAWLESFAGAYDIGGKPAGRVTDEQCRQMVQSLLADRFHLQLHRETKERGVYFLVIAKNGTKLREVKPASPKAGGGVRINRALMQSRRVFSEEHRDAGQRSGEAAAFIPPPAQLNNILLA